MYVTRCRERRSALVRSCFEKGKSLLWLFFVFFFFLLSKAKAISFSHLFLHMYGMVSK
jgi:hypothetical protein